MNLKFIYFLKRSVMKGILGLKTQSQKEVTIEGFPRKKVIAVY